MRGLHEVVPIQDIVCSGIGAIERLDGNLFRFWLYVQQTSDETGAKEKIVVAKIVAPGSAIPDAVMQMIAAIAEGEPSLVPVIADMLN